ncbi:S-formylglutathione hydrolase [Wenxinia marina]|uniref:S-formylglutathione hydrolase n=1 Tax=Wenxinia marina DSM 24838 TaxID=1123501 RepID=A0A0D0QG36_9RHOB|nr:S-formylglutathione hydrolase [Wenxinia marina]KIQ70008.1 S-formylglutathione hydrolase [Wenxinia marina DSM 24838]GGL62812.1 S-formylglutathione hydrolase [Wenxinia marina]
MRTISENRCFGGTQGVYAHDSQATGCEMTFGLFLPEEAAQGPVPVLWFLSGLTCTHENAMVKAGAQAHAALHGIALVFPDTSPRGEGVADDEAFDMGQGAGFYLDATKEPWAPHFRMERYVTEELPKLLFGEVPLAEEQQAITGHSMGGHGALTLAMRHPGRFRSVSAFAPICNPLESDWGQRQFEGYLGSVEAGRVHDATLLMAERGLDAPLMIDTGTADQFGDKLGTAAFAGAVAERRAEATLRLQKGYDHSYFFVSTFMGDHVDFHAEALWA